MAGRVAVILVLAMSLARAQAPDPDTQAARRHYDRGLALYDQERYDEAIREFTAAKELKPMAAFDYNIGRCHERRERWAEAASSYERYLAAQPEAPEHAELQQRIGVLRARARRQQTAPPSGGTPPATSPLTTAPENPVVARRPAYKRAWFWGVLAGGAAAVAVGVGLGVGLTARGGDSSHPIMGVTF